MEVLGNLGVCLRVLGAILRGLEKDLMAFLWSLGGLVEVLWGVLGNLGAHLEVLVGLWRGLVKDLMAFLESLGGLVGGHGES